MEELLYEACRTIQEVIKNSEYENKVYIKGGFIRNLLLDKNMFNDIDVAIAIDGGEIGFTKQMCDWCKCRSIYNPFIEKSKGTALFTLFTHPLLNNVRFDVKTMHGLNVENDTNELMDFTCNALYLNTNTTNIIDATGKGFKDIENKTLRMIHKDIFKKSPVRIVRALRFIFELGLTIEPDTKQQFLEDYKLVFDVQKDWVTKELEKITGSLDDEELNNVLDEIRKSFL
jgi:tRNA nucleotidyltransferase/poly(A) polymerase